MFDVYHLPVLTTIVSAFFLVTMVKKAKHRPDPSMIWWAIGVFTYGVGTAIESSIAFFGNSIALNKAWYVAGALLGGYPLAQGTVYLLFKRRTAHIMTVVTVAIVAIASVLVLISPVNHEAFNTLKPSSDLIGWSWIRIAVPFINTYAAIFLVGGAIVSAVRFFRKGESGGRALGTIYIAVGGLLPGIGGSMAAVGVVEALYIGEFLGVLFLWAGVAAYGKRPKRPGADAAAADAVQAR